MIDIIRKLCDILTLGEKRNAIILFCLILATGVMESVGVVSIMPFLAVLSNPEVIHKNAYLSYTYNTLGFSSSQSFLLFTGILVFVVVVSGLTFKALTQYALTSFTEMRNCTISTRLLQDYLGRPYIWFLNKHSADLGKTVLSEVEQVIQGVLIPISQFIANLVIAACLVITLLLINPLIAVFAAVLLGGVYYLVYTVLRQYLSRIGAERVKANQQRFQIAQEAFGGIKEVKAAGLEAGYMNSFGNPARRFAKCRAANIIIQQIPNFVLEALAFGGILAIILVMLIIRGGDLDQVLPILGVFAFAGQRLLPALRQIYQNATAMRFGKPALDALHVELSEEKNKPLKSTIDVAPLPLKQHIELTNIGFTYPGASQAAIHDLTLKIPANSTVGFVGSTGAGKTTLVDIIMALLPPDHGQLLVDGQPIFEGQKTPASTVDKVQRNSYNTQKQWQRALGYVPQQIFLADDSVSANIAFGVPAKEADQTAVKRAAKIAELHEFVTQELPKGYETTVGERGVRLSGGQRQRIGIARAMYHDPDVLILDEATSALDNITERAIMDAVHNLSRKKTIILIAHRLSTVKKCDQIYLLEHGRLLAQGTYSELLAESQEFKNMAAVDE
ncbi:ABC transporter ATP-binding protein [Candidatus Electrothrix sp.]|uniref:ABC transporter ATP-binding protein n=1 Tax=Candidatus Electrothrix sp. TaxID=2170559 RepID=UPI004056F01A